MKKIVAFLFVTLLFIGLPSKTFADVQPPGGVPCAGCETVCTQWVQIPDPSTGIITYSCANWETTCWNNCPVSDPVPPPANPPPAGTTYTCYQCHPGAAFCESYISNSPCTTSCSSCSDTTSPPVQPKSCSVSLTQIPSSLPVCGTSRVQGKIDSETNGEITQMQFSVRNVGGGGAVANINPVSVNMGTGTEYAYSVLAGLRPGQYQVRVGGIMGGASPTCYSNWQTFTISDRQATPPQPHQALPYGYWNLNPKIFINGVERGHWTNPVVVPEDSSVVVSWSSNTSSCQLTRFGWNYTACNGVNCEPYNQSVAGSGSVYFHHVKGLSMFQIACNNASSNTIGLSATDPVDQPNTIAASCFAPTTPSCSIRLSPNPLLAKVGEDAVLAVIKESEENGTISEVRFSMSPVLGTLTPVDNTAPNFTTTARGTAEGTATITAQAVMDGQVRCQATATANFTPPDAWWQTTGGSVISKGSVISSIPPTCILPSCNPVLITNGRGGYPGVLIHGSSQFDFSSLGTSTGSVSSRGWRAQTVTPAAYNYDYFRRLVPSFIQLNSLGNIAVGGTPDNHGYVWYSSGTTSLGNVTIPANRKVVLFVDGNLAITGPIRVSNPRNSMLMVIVRGAIAVSPTVTNTVGPALEGVYVADTFESGRTGGADSRLVVRGAVYAQNVSFTRDLRAQNTIIPAESIEFAPEYLLNYPPNLSAQRLVWKEVNP